MLHFSLCQNAFCVLEFNLSWFQNIISRTMDTMEIFWACSIQSWLTDWNLNESVRSNEWSIWKDPLLALVPVSRYCQTIWSFQKVMKMQWRDAFLPCWFVPQTVFDQDLLVFGANLNSNGMRTPTRSHSATRSMRSQRTNNSIQVLHQTEHRHRKSFSQTDQPIPARGCGWRSSLTVAVFGAVTDPPVLMLRMHHTAQLQNI